MSRHIIQAIRHQTQLRTVTRTIAIEIAHRMNSNGIGRIAYSFLAHKAACSIRTAIRHVKKLVALGLFRKRTTKAATGYSWNVYEYTGPRAQPPPPPITTHYANLTPSLPEAEREKDTSVQEELDNQRKGLRFLTAGSEWWIRGQEEIARLEGLLTC